MMPVSEAITGWILNPVRKRMSSITSKSVGSTMAIVKKDRMRWMGMMRCFLATSTGIRFTTSG